MIHRDTYLVNSLNNNVSILQSDFHLPFWIICDRKKYRNNIINNFIHRNLE